MHRKEQDKELEELLDEDEALVIAAMRRMSQEEKKYTVGYVLRFAPEMQDRPQLTLIAGGRRS